MSPDGWLQLTVCTLLWGNIIRLPGLVNRFVCLILVFFRVDVPCNVPYVHRLAAGADGAKVGPVFPRIRKARFVNVTVENVGPCRRLLRIQADVNEVEQAFEEVTRDFLKHATLPGFRPGKAPKDMVVRRFEKEIKEETQHKLIRELYKQAVEQEKLEVYHLEDVETVTFERGQPMQITVTVEIVPDFQLPAYFEIPVRVESRTVTEEDVDKALEALRQQQKKYVTVDRPATAEDVLVIDAKGTLDGAPVTEKLGANVAMYESLKGFWVGAKRELGPNFFQQLIGTKGGEKRTVQVTYPDDFTPKELAGKTLTFEVDVREVREAVLPALGDELAKELGAENLEALRKGVRTDLENEARYQENNQVFNQVSKFLLESANFEVPPTAVQDATRREVYRSVASLQQHGLSPEEIEGQKDKIYAHSQMMAAGRVRLDFILEKIAKAENITVTNEELTQHLSYLAYQRQVELPRFLKEVRENGELPQIYHRLLMEKTLGIVAAKAKVVREPAAAAPAEASPSPSPQA